jgi:hypothetical protein
MTDYYVSVEGLDTNQGTVERPFSSLQFAHDHARPGDTIYIRGGVHKITAGIELTNGGTSGKPITVRNYPGETPILEGAEMTQAGYYQGWVLSLTGSEWNHMKCLEIRGGPEGGLSIRDSSHNVIERLNVHHNGRMSRSEGKGIVLYGNSSNNLLLNNDSHHNEDLNRDNADGFQISTTGTGNILRANRAWNNSDDGFDLFNVHNNTDAGSVLIEGNWAWENGYDLIGNPAGDGAGFKLGGTRAGTGGTSGGHTVINNIAWGNRRFGFDENGSERSVTLYNNTAMSNGLYNFLFARGTPDTLRNNVSLGAGRVSVVGTVETNSWDLFPVLAGADFASLDDAIARGMRAPDGTLPSSTFLVPARGGRLIDRGTDVGLPYSGAAPELGAFEVWNARMNGTYNRVSDTNNTTSAHVSVPSSFLAKISTASMNTVADHGWIIVMLLSAAFVILCFVYFRRA